MEHSLLPLREALKALTLELAKMRFALKSISGKLVNIRGSATDAQVANHWGKYLMRSGTMNGA